MDKSKKRADLLQAAIDIVNEQGTNYLTLDAVAKRAGVSKGGLLYHFESKQALIQGLVDYANTLYRENVDKSVTESESSGALLRGYIEATRKHRDENAAVTSTILAAHSNNKALLSPLQETYQEWQSEIAADQQDNVDATIIRLAIDGLWLSEIFGLDAIDEKTREAVLDRLIEYTRK